MFESDDSYSTFVTWVKTLLPIIALAMLSTLFLFSGKVDVTKSLPYAELNVDEIIREQRISQPYFTGISETGTQIALSAAFATPDPATPDQINIGTLFARFVTADQEQISMRADQGMMNSRAKTASISGNVKIMNSTGFAAKTDQLIVDLENARALSPGPLVAATTLGTLEAGALHVQGIAGDQQIIFTNGVRLVYTPQQN
ncbi:MAG: LPS export ABC transporter periplasmic protein LptC [Planktomarina sp.]